MPQESERVMNDYEQWIWRYMAENGGLDALRNSCAKVSTLLQRAFPEALRIVQGRVVLSNGIEIPQHQWCVDTTTGEIVDPTAMQYQHASIFEYIPYIHTPDAKCLHCGAIYNTEQSKLNGTPSYTYTCSPECDKGMLRYIEEEKNDWQTGD